MMTNTKPAEQIAYFNTSAAAWRFFAECEKRGDMPGYPSLTAGPDGYSVRWLPAASVPQ